MNTLYNRIFIILWSSMVLLFLIPLFKNGYIIFGDIDFGVSIESYMERVLGTWNELWSTPNSFNLSRMPVVMLFIGTLKTLSIPASLAPKLLIYCVLWMSGYSMWCFLWDIQAIKNNRFILSTSLFIALCACIYAFSPYAIIRIQHLYLLIGYAFIPFIMMFYNRVLCSNNAILRNIFFTSLCLFIASSAIHYFFFSVFLLVFITLIHIILQLYKGTETSFYTVFMRLGSVILIAILLQSFTFLPQIYGILEGVRASMDMNTIDSLHTFSRFTSLKHVLSMSSYWWIMMPDSAFDTFFTVSITVFITLLSTLSILFIRYFWIRISLIICIITILFAFGTNSFMRDIYIWSVFSSPISGIIGFLFRDPHKLLGLTSLFYSVIIGVSLPLVHHIMYENSTHITPQKQLLEALFPYKKHIHIPYYTLSYTLFISFIIAFIGIVKPFYTHYIQYYYAPIDIPKSYFTLHNHIDKSKKVLYLPRNEYIISPAKDYAEAYFNTNKPTSAIDIYGTETATYTALEGATKAFIPYTKYLEYALFYNTSTALYYLINPLFIGTIAYHSDIYGYENEAYNAIKTLLSQHNTTRFIDDDIWFLSFYDTYKNTFMDKNTPLYIASKGFYKYNTIASLLPQTLINSVLLPLSDMYKIVDYLDYNDVIDVQFEEDMILSIVDKQYFYAPARYIKSGNPFIKWAKTSTTNTDWYWHLEHLGITHHSFEDDNNDGIVFTYAPQMMDIAPWKDDISYGKHYMTTTDFYTKTPDFFTADDKEVATITFAPTDAYRELPLLHGTIDSGKTKYWKIATSDMIAVQELMGYRFEMALSGYNTHTLHGKVKYYDSDDNELTVSYITAPKRSTVFDKIRFSGEFITPKNTHHIRLQLWTHQRPDTKLSWWIHSFTMNTMDDYMKPNSFIIPIKSDMDHTKYHMYARVFMNKEGGTIAIKVKNKEYILSTKTTPQAEFVWIYIGDTMLSKGFTDMQISNIEGVNSIMNIAVIPDNEHQKAINMIPHILSKTRSIYTFEPSIDAIKEGNIQTDTMHKELTNGQSMVLKNGRFVVSMDIGEASKYSIYTDIPYYNSDKDSIKIAIKRDGEVLYEYDYNGINTFFYDFLEGTYNIVYTVKTKLQPLINTASLHQFEYDNEWREKDIYTDTLRKKERFEDCCECVSLPENYMNDAYDAVYNSYKMHIESGCSCWWVISSSAITPAFEDTEYLISFLTSTENTVKAHYKIVYLDSNNTYLDHLILPDTPTKNTIKREFIERLFTTPKGTKYLQFQVWTRQNHTLQSHITIQNLDIYRYKDLPHIDSIAVLEEQKTATEALKDRFITRTYESYNQLWKMDNAVLVRENGVMSTFISHHMPSTQPYFSSEKYWKYGIIISIITCFIGIIGSIKIWK